MTNILTQAQKPSKIGNRPSTPMDELDRLRRQASAAAGQQVSLIENLLHELQFLRGRVASLEEKVYKQSVEF